MQAMRNRLAVAMVIVGFFGFTAAGLALAGESHGDTMSLSGCLNQGQDGNFTLVERESGDSISIKAPENLRLADHVGETVKVTGQWVEKESEYQRYFKVSEIETVSASCQS